MSQATGVRADVAISQTLANEAQLTSVRGTQRWAVGWAAMETGSDGMHLDTFMGKFMIFQWETSWIHQNNYSSNQYFWITS